MTPAELEARIRVEVEAAKAEGFTIARGLYFSTTGRKTCCALAACARQEIAEERLTPFIDRRDDGRVIRDTIGLSCDEFVSFINGFDCRDRQDEDANDFYALGASIGRLYVDGAS